MKKLILLSILLIVGCDNSTEIEAKYICVIYKKITNALIAFDCYNNVNEATCIEYSEQDPRYQVEKWDNDVTCEEFCVEPSSFGWECAIAN